ncbi:MAG: PE-PPE domain-containing protein [Mycobacterium sp.]|uniref:PE-PPE domain-containing protein n=1 Tax=Mycobacterium sp. TaxID=1785 RepID=UPI003C320C3D
MHLEGEALRLMLHLHRTLGVALVGASLITVSPLVPPSPDVQVRAARLTSGDTADSPLGDGTAFIMGGSGLETPGQTYADVIDAVYLAPRGFTGTTQVLTTPEALYPFLGPFTETFDKSEAQGQQILDAAILNQIAGGHVDAANPVVVSGWSQSAVISSLLQPELASHGVPSDDVHFVLMGDESAPNGGMLERFDLPAGTQPTIPSLGLTFSGPEASDLYPTDVYTHEYDGFADFPQYPINPLSDLNAVLGIVFEHVTYPGLTAAQVADAIQLPTSAADTLTNYYELPVTTLPLLEPLQLIPFIGNPLADLLNPDLSVLVNLGYGDVADNYLGGWSQGDADVPTPLGFLPDSSVLEQVPQALANGLHQGITDALKDLADPNNYVYTLPSWADQLGATLEAVLPGTQLSVFSIVPTTFQDLFDTLPPHTGFPPFDVAEALLITLPELDYNVFTTELAANNPVDAIGIPIAADIGILPLALIGAAL